MKHNTPGGETVSALSLDRLSAALDALSVSIDDAVRLPGVCIERTMISEGYWIEERNIVLRPDLYVEEFVHVAVAHKGGGSAKIEWTPRCDSSLTTLGVGISLFNRSDLNGMLIWEDWCERTGNSEDFHIPACWWDFGDTQPRSFLRNFHVEVTGERYLAFPDISK